MKNNLIIKSIKERIKSYNVIIYGTIRDIESDFLSSFINLELISKLFNKVQFIILENDSTDNTRKLLEEWSKNGPNRKIILLDNLNYYFPFRATRLAFCRNEILNYIKKEKLEKEYQYAIHCDLDNRFWSFNPDSICHFFDNSCKGDWDMMSAVSTGRSYYDYWALRCENTWFDKNIFSCENQGIRYETKVDTFESLLKNSEAPILVQSSFNGMAIYKLKSLILSEYCASYFCNKCNNHNDGCREDNDHIGLHKKMCGYGHKLYVNNKVEIHSRKEHYTPYQSFIDNVMVEDIKKDIFTWLIYNEKIDTLKDVIFLGEKSPLCINSVSKYFYENHSNKFIYFIGEKDYWFFNDNVKKIANIEDIKAHNFSLIFFSEQDYGNAFNYLDSIKSFITSGTLIIFTDFFNYENYHKNVFKAFYEFVQIHNFNFKWLLTNSTGLENKTICIEFLDIASSTNEDLNINYNSSEYIEFDWIQYTNFYSDLSHITSKDVAYKHWKSYGIEEGREYFKKEQLMEITFEQSQIVVSEGFDWEMYLDLNSDLRENGIIKEVDAINHWFKHGKSEKRRFKFDWCKYIENNNLITLDIDCKEKAIAHWKEAGCPDQEDIDINEEMFDWVYYIQNNKDLSHLNNYESARYHWVNYGKKEGRVCHSFSWTEYLMENPDLVDEGIDTEIKAYNHWKLNKVDN